MSPSSKAKGNNNVVLTVTGTNFRTGATVTFINNDTGQNGISIDSVTFGSGTQLSVQIDIATNAKQATRDVVVSNSDGTSATCSNCFTVT